MVEQKTQNEPNNLEDTVRSLQEENAKLLQLLISQGFPLESLNNSDGKTVSSNNILFQNSDVTTTTTNTVNTINQVNHQQINNYAPINQQNFSGQVVHGHQSNANPNFNTVIQTSNQPFVQNNSNTLVQNNTNVIQPINLVNINNVSLDSIQSFLATQNNLLYMPQTAASSSSSTTTTTTTATTTTTNNVPTPTNNPFNSNLLDTDQSHQVSIRPKPMFSQQQQQQQDLVSMSSKAKSEAHENLTRQSSLTPNTETTNLLDNDMNHKQPRPILPKPLARAQSVQIYNSISLTETKPIIGNVLTPSSLINNTTNTSSTVSILSPTTSFDETHNDLSPQLNSSKSVDGFMSSNSNIATPNKKPPKPRSRNRKSTTSSSATAAPSSSTSTTTTTITSTTPTPIPIAPNIGRPLAPAPLNVQRVVTSTAKRSATAKRRPSKPLAQYHSDSVLQQNPSPMSDPFAESISGLLQNFDQELMASNFLPQTTVTTTNIISNESSNGNLIQSFDHIDFRQIVNTTIQSTENFSTISSITDFNERVEQETSMISVTGHDFHVDPEPITSLISDEELHLVEMNFDENAFLKQFDMEESTLKYNSSIEQPIYTSLLSSRQTSTITSETSTSSIPPPHPVYPGSSLINNNVFTTVVPLAMQHQTSVQHPPIRQQQYSSRFAPEEGVQLTARHLEPSQVATYESGKYQDILDELVTITDQDVLTHAQATAADTVTDQNVLSADFTFDLIEATNEIIKTTDIEVAEAAASAFVDLQYFYPLEQEEEDMVQENIDENTMDEHESELIQKVSEMDDMKQTEEFNAPVENESTTVIASVDSPKSDVETGITDLSSIIQISQVEEPSSMKSPIEQVAQVIDYDALLPPIREPTPPPMPSPPNLTTNMIEASSDSPLRRAPTPRPSPPPSPVPPPSPPKSPANMDSQSPSSILSPVTVVTTNLNTASIQPSPSAAIESMNIASPITETSSRVEMSQTTNRPARIIFEPIFSPENPTSPNLPFANDMILNTDGLNSSFVDKVLPVQEHESESSVKEHSTEQLKTVENQDSIRLENDVAVENVDKSIEKPDQQSVEQEMKADKMEDSKMEDNKTEDNKTEDNKVKEMPKEQYSPIPSVKLKLNSIYLKEESRAALKNASIERTATEEVNGESVRAPIKIKIRTKLPLPPPSTDSEEMKIISRTEENTPMTSTETSTGTSETLPALPKLKIRKPIKKTKRRKLSTSGDDHFEFEGKCSSQTEYAGLTRFEQSLAQLYNQTSSSPHGQIPPTPGDNDDSIVTATNTDDQHQSPTMTINESKPSIRSPLTTNQGSTKKLSYLFHGNDDRLTKTTFITPPPDIDSNAQQQSQSSKSSDELYQHTKKVKKHHPSSSTSSSKVRHSSSSSRVHHESTHLLTPPTSNVHLDSYAQSYHQFNGGSAPFFPFPFPNHYLNPHTSAQTNHFHSNPMKYHHQIHPYQNHQPTFNYHHHNHHLQQQQQHPSQFHSPNYMSSRDHHPFTR